MTGLFFCVGGFYTLYYQATCRFPTYDLNSTCLTQNKEPAVAVDILPIALELTPFLPDNQSS